MKRLLLLTLLFVALGGRAQQFQQEVVQGDSVGVEHSRQAFDKAYLEEAISLLSTYIKIPSITGQEEEAGTFLAAYAKDKDLHITYFSHDSNSYNFAASLFPLFTQKPNIVLLNHIDVVPEGDTTYWKHAPFSGKVDSSYVWGRGAIDSKGLGVMQLMALLRFKEKYADKDLPYNITLLSVSNEEDGGKLGAKLITDHYLRYLNPAVVLGEGGAGFSGVLSSKPEARVFGVSVAEKSSLWLEMELQYNTFGHGATPAINYANKELIQALSSLNNRKLRLRFNRTNRRMMRELGKAEGGIKGFFMAHSNWSILNPLVVRFIKNDPLYLSLFTNTITVTQLSNPPGPPNSIPSLASATLDCRLLPGVKKQAFMRQIDYWVKNPHVKFKVLNESPMAEATKPDEFYDALKASIQSEYPESYVLPVLFPATTDNSFFRLYDVPTYGIIPAIFTQEDLESVHNYNERISFEALQSGIRVYLRFLETLQKPKERRLKLPLLDKKK
ncbi:M20/M25/M40 family metallo-hydrolase [Cytophagales bacterium LB-30]|uniref:M20/M25/M40 family metallo-hydrolase n=1 Tax=Shiella aurantiaca TaxID=3058365 RepID=A0ABT8F1V4_9BACT|nr:M20/M25/M40 family metallo-hydrolase [Shiella aurantiaca]MDN4164016.1 M20/M25/M40 family metallo-hydrolase [Shiella aurantiaca]